MTTLFTRLLPKIMVNTEETLVVASRQSEQRASSRLNSVASLLQEDSPFDALVPLAEMVRLRDTSMISFEISVISSQSLLFSLLIVVDVSIDCSKNQ